MHAFVPLELHIAVCRSAGNFEGPIQWQKIQIPPIQTLGNITSHVALVDVWTSRSSGRRQLEQCLPQPPCTLSSTGGKDMVCTTSLPCIFRARNWFYRWRTETISYKSKITLVTAGCLCCCTEFVCMISHLASPAITRFAFTEPVALLLCRVQNEDFRRPLFLETSHNPRYRC